jgi:3-methyladenine DNA glycosylase AlkD
VHRFVRSLLRDATWAERAVAFEVLGGHDALALVDDRFAEQMANGLSDWASVDLYGVTVLGQAWRDGRVTDAKIHAWTKSSDRWKRRLALVATVPLNIPSRGGTGDSRRTLRVCRLLRDDRDDMVVKAMSWALRELAKRDPGGVRSFMSDQEDRLAPRVKREVSSKLGTGLKTPRK